MQSAHSVAITVQSSVHEAGTSLGASEASPCADATSGIAAMTSSGETTATSEPASPVTISCLCIGNHPHTCSANAGAAVNSVAMKNTTLSSIARYAMKHVR